MRSNNIKYFEVVAKCGHVGRTKCIMIHFAVEAENAKDAAIKVKSYKRVKRNHKDCIRSVSKISRERFDEITETNKNDPYLKCKSKWQHKLINGFGERVEADRYNISRNQIRKNKKGSRNYRLKKMAYRIRNEIQELLFYSYCA